MEEIELRPIDDILRDMRKLCAQTPSCPDDDIKAQLQKDYHIIRRMTLSVACITKGEETIHDMIRSIKDIADEIVIVTCNNKRADINDFNVEGKGKIYYREWTDDFAAARNFCYSKCTSDYIIWLDSDDVVPPESAALIRAALDKPGPKTANKLCFFSLPVVSTIEGEADGQSYIQARISPNHPFVEWVGKIHETHIDSLVMAGMTNVEAPNIPIYHTGYDNREEMMDRIKTRNVPMLLKEKDTPLKYYHLAQSALCLGDWIGASMNLNLLEEKFGETLEEDFAEEVKNCQARCHLALKRFDEAREIFEKSKRSDALYYLAILKLEDGDLPGAEELFNQFLNSKQETSHWGTAYQQLRYFSYLQLIDINILPVKKIQDRARAEFPVEPKWRKQDKINEMLQSQNDNMLKMTYSDIFK